MGTRIKKGDIVQIIAGKKDNIGKMGKVLKVLDEKDRVIVEGINLVKKSSKGDPANNKPGGIITEPAPLHLSNAMPYCNNCHKGVRVRFERHGHKVIRKCAKCGAVLEYK